MKVDLYTYNRPLVQYHQPTFMARPIKVDWNSDSGKKLEKVLVWMGASAMASIMAYKKDKDGVNLSDEEKAVMDEYLDFDEDAALLQAKALLSSSYLNTKDEKIMDKHWQLYKDAYKNKTLLRGGYSELDDYTFTYTFMDSKVIHALDLLGKGVLESAFSLDIQGFENFCENISDMKKNISNQNIELLKKKINPESSNEYKNLEDEIRKSKKEIGKLLGEGNSQKRKELLAQIDSMKGDKTKVKEIKDLKRQIQDLYKNCENAEQISALMTGINEKQREKKELVNNKVKLSPQEIINKVWTIASISTSPHYYTNIVTLPDNYREDKKQTIASIGKGTENDGYIIETEKIMEIIGDDYTQYIGKNKRKLNRDIKELIDLIQPSSPENDKAWNNNINKKLYEYANLKYSTKYADKIDLANCKYLNELIVSDEDFWSYMTEFLQAIAEYLYVNPNKSIDDALEEMEHNKETKQIFTERKIDYDKWSHYDKDSFIESPVVIKAEDAKRKAVKNMCDDITSKNLKIIPAKVRKSLYKALSEVGVTVNKNEVKINGRDVKFEDLDLIMSAIKTELSNNEFWSVESSNEVVDKARDTIYCHFMLQRKQEIDCAKKLKDSETVNVKVQKVNMADIKHSLCLGNHSHCCTGLGSQSNEYSAPLYILNRCISAIEVLADGEPVGNTMIYLADIHQDGEKHLALVLDDIELQTKFQNNEKIKDMIIEYAKKVCSEIGQPNIPIYAGPGMHKVEMSNYPLMLSNMEILGKSPEDYGVYLDCNGEQNDIAKDIIEVTDLYKIA